MLVVAHRVTPAPHAGVGPVPFYQLREGGGIWLKGMNRRVGIREVILLDRVADVCTHINNRIGPVTTQQ